MLSFGADPTSAPSAEPPAKPPARTVARFSAVDWGIIVVGLACALYGLATRGKRLRENPGGDDEGGSGDDLETAKGFREAFHWGYKAKKTKRVTVAKPPRHLVKLGRLKAVIYETNKKGDGPSEYIHEFGEEGGRRPDLASDPRGKRLFIVGGDYRVTERGIED